MFASNTATTKVCLDCNATLANSDATSARHNCIDLMVYYLKTMLDDTATGVKIQATDDDDASMQAIGIILDRAINNDLWAKGHITLRDREGRLVREMPAKNIAVTTY
jgi:hypothetical protein